MIASLFADIYHWSNQSALKIETSLKYIAIIF